MASISGALTVVGIVGAGNVRRDLAARRQGVYGTQGAGELVSAHVGRERRVLCSSVRKERWWQTNARRRRHAKQHKRTRVLGIGGKLDNVVDELVRCLPSEPIQP